MEGRGAHSVTSGRSGQEHRTLSFYLFELRTRRIDSTNFVTNSDAAGCLLANASWYTCFLQQRSGHIKSHIQGLDLTAKTFHFSYLHQGPESSSALIHCRSSHPPALLLYISGITIKYLSQQDLPQTSSCNSMKV